MKFVRNVVKELKLFKYLMDTYHLQTDADLADFMLCSDSVVSMTRRGQRALSARLILIIYDKTPLSVEEIRAMLKEYV